MSDTLATTLVGQLLKWEAERPDDVYLVQPLPNGDVESFTWKAVARQVKKIASYLQSCDFPANSQIAILGKNSAHWIMADLAIMLAGHVSVPLYPSLDSDSANYILDHSESRLLFVGKLDVDDAAWSAYQQALPVDLPRVMLPLSPIDEIAESWEVLVRSYQPRKSDLMPTAEGLATIIYTSGSTGKPKGVMHSSRSMFAVCDGFLDLMSMSKDDRMLSYLPLAHAAERAIVETASLYYGFSVYFSDNQATFVKDLQRAQPTVFFSVPRLWLKFYTSIEQTLTLEQSRMLTEDTPESAQLRQKILTQLGLQAARIGITGSAPIPETIVNWYCSLGLELLDCYGMSENFATSHVSRPGQVRVGYVGSPASGVEARISPSGELEVKSPGQMMGYFKAPEKMRLEMTEDGFFKTGDCGEIDELGRLKITGRVKDIFKTSKGKYVAPVPIEQRLGAIPGNESVCVMGSGFPQPFAVIVLSEECGEMLSDSAKKDTFDKHTDSLLVDLNQNLAAHERLAFIVFVRDVWSIENGFLTPTLKIKRAIIENAYEGAAQHWFDVQDKVIHQSL